MNPWSLHIPNDRGNVVTTFSTTTTITITVSEHVIMQRCVFRNVTLIFCIIFNISVRTSYYTYVFFFARVSFFCIAQCMKRLMFFEIVVYLQREFRHFNRKNIPHNIKVIFNFGERIRVFSTWQIFSIFYFSCTFVVHSHYH